MISKLALYLIFLILFQTNLLALKNTDKNNLIATEILSLSFGGFLGYYGIKIDDGKYELGLGLGYFHPNSGNVKAIGLYPSIRTFHSNRSVGIFYEAGLGLGRFKWDYENSFQPIKKVLFFPSVYLGYRIASNFSLTITPYIGMNYISGSLKAKDGNIARFGELKLDSGLSPALGLELGYLF